MAEDLSALRAKVETYESELRQVLAEGQRFAAAWPQSTSSAQDGEARDAAEGLGFLTMLQIVGRRLDLMEKYETALRNYMAALEKRVRQLEKERPKYDLGIQP